MLSATTQFWVQEMRATVVSRMFCFSFCLPLFRGLYYIIIPSPFLLLAAIYLK
jgi:hypothetical protein